LHIAAAFSWPFGVLTASLPLTGISNAITDVLVLLPLLLYALSHSVEAKGLIIW
jgi:hypothetical protein